MSESRPKKRRVEFIESYWTGGELGSDYQWNDNHGELIRCKDCMYWKDEQARSRQTKWLPCMEVQTYRNWLCADGQRNTDNG